MKNFSLILLSMLFAFSVNGQDKYLTKNGHAWFISETPMETIEAHNKQVTAILSTDGKIAFKILMKSFQFEKALMQEHFNENYVESDKYPKATFEGAITNMGEVSLDKDGKYEAIIEGVINFHGVSKKVSERAFLEVKNGKIQGTCQLIMVLKDYEIKVPSVVADNIAKEITVNLEVALEPYSR